MKRIGSRIDTALWIYGVSPSKAFRAVKGTFFYLRDLRAFRKMLPDGAEWRFGMFKPMLEDREAYGGIASGHYFHQDLLVARRIHKANPRRHIDVGSRIDGFVAHVASFRNVEVIDIRPMETNAANITFLQVDITEQLQPDFVGICDSLSCLHALEHFGLGRYGDRVDPYGYKPGFANLVTMLEPQGILYFSVPIGRQRIEFNSQRIFSLSYLLDMFRSHELDLLSFSYVDDRGDLIENADLSPDRMRVLGNLSNGCGIFELRKARSS